MRPQTWRPSLTKQVSKDAAFPDHPDHSLQENMIHENHMVIIDRVLILGGGVTQILVVPMMIATAAQATSSSMMRWASCLSALPREPSMRQTDAS